MINWQCKEVTVAYFKMLSLYLSERYRAGDLRNTDHSIAMLSLSHWPADINRPACRWLTVSVCLGRLALLPPMFKLNRILKLVKQNLIRQSVSVLTKARNVRRLRNLTVIYISVLIYWDIKTCLMPRSEFPFFILHLFFFPPVFTPTRSLFLSMQHIFLHQAGRKVATMYITPQIWPITLPPLGWLW
jgi:hypothetical protein